MLSIFPQLLDYGFYGPTVLRVGAGLYLLALAYQTVWGAKKDTKFILDYYPMFKPQGLFVGVATVGTLIVATLMTIGLYTQIVAVVSILIGLKMIALEKIYGRNFGFSTSTHLLIILIQIALLVMGPGALALDLPL